MASAFDPSAFIQAEQSQSVAANSYRQRDAFSMEETADFRRSEPTAAPALATIAGIAAPHAQNLPWDAELRVWAESERPDWIRPALWDELTHEAVAVSRKWGAIALAAGWTSLNLFGCHTDPRGRRQDRNGLVQTIVTLLSAVKITSLTSAYAELVDLNGAILRYRPRVKPGSVHLWEAYAMPTGP